jgi:DNA-binding MarR family transcriptional regulator
MHGRGMHVGARIRLLEVLAAASPDARLGISEVADAIGVDQPRASRLVADAAGRGLVSREVDPRDARKSVLSITEAGRAFLEQIRSGRRSAVTDALAGFSDEEAAQLAELLTRFVAAWRP